MSDKTKILNKIKSMKNKSWMHSGRTFKLIDYEIGEQFIIIITENDYIRKPLQSALKYLEECLPVADEPRLPIKHNGEILIMEENNIFNDVKNLLLENIKRVQEDPKYVNQAKVVNSSVQTILNIVKNKIEIAKLSQFGK